jgi:predicted HAD superfamily Cof-like phosphohydrolase|tara:strand:+ start:1659 stop:2057 length:399 start_codon:yes stop_codon:yes gene_type:complete
MIEKPINSVKKFHDAFNIDVSVSPTVDLPLNKIKLRFKLMSEENKEYFEAAKNKDLIEIADALGDMLYILCGTILTHGMQDKIEEVFNAIQDSNMSKLGEDGKPIYRKDGKVLKGPNYFKPNLKKIFREHNN